MPASRWNDHIIELLRWFEEEDQSLEDLIYKPIMPHVLEDEEAHEKGISRPGDLEGQIPSSLPILPLRGVVVYPHTAVPLTIGQPRSIRLVDDVVAGETRLIGLVASKNPDLEVPKPKDLFSVGTVAVVHRLFRAPDGTIRLLVQGLARFRVGEFIAQDPYLEANIELIPETVEEGLEIEALTRNAREQFDKIAEMIPSIPRELVASVTGLEDSLQTVYTIANFQRMDLGDAQNLLEIDSVA